MDYQEQSSIRDAMATGAHSLWDQEQLFDYTIKADNKSFRVHKVIMASTSDFFKVMLTGTMRESQEDFVELKGVSAVALKVLIEFIYSGDLHLTMDNVENILAGADHLQIQPAIKMCTIFMTDSLNNSSCFAILDIFWKYSLDASKVKAYIKERSPDLIALIRRGMVDLRSYDGVRLLMTDWPCSELDLFLVLKEWVMADFNNRKQYIDELMSEVRFALINPADLVDIKQMKIYLDSNAPWQYRVDCAMRYHEQPIYMKVLNESEQSTVRTKPTVAAFAFGTEDPYTSSFLALDKKEWKTVPMMIHADTTDCLGKHVLVVNNFLVLYEGTAVRKDEEDIFGLHSQNCYIFDPRTQTWAQVSNMARPRGQFGFVHHGKNLYAIGGWYCNPRTGDVEPTNTIERFDFETNTWNDMVSLPLTPTALHVCVCGDFIYVLCFETLDKRELARMKCFNIMSGRWENKSSMLATVCVSSTWMRVLEWKEEAEIIVFNDCYPYVQIECYKPSIDQWSLATWDLDSIPESAPFKEEWIILAQDVSLYFINGNILRNPPDSDSDGDAEPEGQVDLYKCAKVTFSKNSETPVMEDIDDFPLGDLAQPTAHCVILSIPVPVIEIT